MLVTGIVRSAVRFSFSPIQETLRAARVFVDPGPHAEQAAWLRYARRRATPALKAGLKRIGFLLYPAPELFAELFPSSQAPTFEDELALLRHSETSRLRRAVHREVCATLETFFERCLSDRWAGYEQRALEDANARQVLLKRFGITGMLRTLTRQITATGTARKASLQIGGSAERVVAFDATATLDLTPSYFIWPHTTAIVLKRRQLEVRIAYPLASPTTFRPRATAWSEIAQRFSALADPTRLQMLDLLEDRDLSTREFAGLIGLSEAGVSRHLAILRAAELVTSVRESYFVLYRRTALAVAYLHQARER